MITDKTVAALWQSFGDLHVHIQARRRLLTQIEIETTNAAETHLLNGLRSKLDEMDATLNQANVFIKDYEPMRVVNQG